MKKKWTWKRILLEIRLNRALDLLGRTQNIINAIDDSGEHVPNEVFAAFITLFLWIGKTNQ